MSLLERFLSSRVERVSASYIRIPGRIVSEQHRPLILTGVNFKGTKVQTYFLIDTGAKISLIMPNDQSRLGLIFDDTRATRSAGFFNEYTMRCMTQELAVTFAGFTLDQETIGKKPLVSIRTMVNFYIPDPQQANVDCPSILGLDVLSLFDLSYDRDFVSLETGEDPNPKLRAYRVRGKNF